MSDPRFERRIGSAARRRTLLSAALLVAAAFAGSRPARAEPPADPLLEQPMYVSPALPEPGRLPPQFDPRLKALWLQALKRPDADTRRIAADAIARAYPLGFKDLAEAADPLRAMLEDPHEPPAV